MDALSVVGATEHIDVIVGYNHTQKKEKRSQTARRQNGAKRLRFDAVPAKIDTGAAGSAIWASDIRVDEKGSLHFKLFGKSSPFYNGEELTYEHYKVGLIRSSNGQEEMRYRVYMTLSIAGKKVHALVSLADRSKNLYPILIGRRTIAHKFVVDVRQQRAQPDEKLQRRTTKLARELQENPAKFHQKYMQDQQIIAIGQDNVDNNSRKEKS